MAIWTPLIGAANTALNTVPKTRVTTIKLHANGLMPNSSYTFWCNGADMTWACRVTGARQGAGLISDQYGSMIVLFSAELVEDYSGNEGTKYSSMQLKNIAGDVHSFSIAQQTLIGK